MDFLLLRFHFRKDSKIAEVKQKWFQGAEVTFHLGVIQFKGLPNFLHFILDMVKENSANILPHCQSRPHILDLSPATKKCDLIANFFNFKKFGHKILIYPK